MLPRAVGAVSSKPGLASLLEGALPDGCVKIAASAAAAAIAVPSIAHLVAPVVLADAALATPSFSFKRPAIHSEVRGCMHGRMLHPCTWARQLTCCSIPKAHICHPYPWLQPDTGELKSILSVFHPRAILTVLAKKWVAHLAHLPHAPRGLREPHTCTCISSTLGSCLHVSLLSSVGGTQQHSACGATCSVGVSALVRFNIYMVELLDHENRAHELEAQVRPAGCVMGGPP
jgi:hypothetical protein